MKIDVVYFLEHIGTIVSLFVMVLLLKTLITFIVVRFTSPTGTALKTALSISQVGEFSFFIR